MEQRTYDIKDIYLIPKMIGLRGTVEYLMAEKIMYFLKIFGKKTFKNCYTIHLRGIDHPLYCRYGTSDRSVFRQIFIKAYNYDGERASPRFIVDCGAYIGYSTVYFLNRYPNAQVLAVEPDAGNYEMLVKNIKPYGKRVNSIRVGVWSHSTGLKVVRGGYRDGRDWSTQVRNCQAQEIADIRSIDIGTLLSESGFNRIDILKLDIEGAEFVLFSKNYDHWIDKVDMFIIELHDEKCRLAFMNAIKDRLYTCFRSGEVTIARRLTDCASAEI